MNSDSLLEKQRKSPGNHHANAFPSQNFRFLRPQQESPSIDPTKRTRQIYNPQNVQNVQNIQNFQNFQTQTPQNERNFETIPFHLDKGETPQRQIISSHRNFQQQRFVSSKKINTTLEQPEEGSKDSSCLVHPKKLRHSLHNKREFEIRRITQHNKPRKFEKSVNSIKADCHSQSNLRHGSGNDTLLPKRKFQETIPCQIDSYRQLIPGFYERDMINRSNDQQDCSKHLAKNVLSVKELKRGREKDQEAAVKDLVGYQSHVNLSYGRAVSQASKRKDILQVVKSGNELAISRQTAKRVNEDLPYQSIDPVQRDKDARRVRQSNQEPVYPEMSDSQHQLQNTQNHNKDNSFERELQLPIIDSQMESHMLVNRPETLQNIPSLRVSRNLETLRPTGVQYSSQNSNSRSSSSKQKTFNFDVFNLSRNHPKILNTEGSLAKPECLSFGTKDNHHGNIDKPTSVWCNESISKGSINYSGVNLSRANLSGSKPNLSGFQKYISGSRQNLSGMQNSKAGSRVNHSGPNTNMSYSRPSLSGLHANLSINRGNLHLHNTQINKGGMANKLPGGNDWSFFRSQGLEETLVGKEERKNKRKEGNGQVGSRSSRGDL